MKSPIKNQPKGKISKGVKSYGNDLYFPTKNKILQDIKDAVEEVKLIKAGKLKGIPAKDLINEL